MSKKKKVRKANGMGSAYKVGNNWYAKYTADKQVDDTTHKVTYVRRTAGPFQTETEARRYSAEHYMCEAGTLDNAKDRKTLRDYHDFWLVNKAPKLSKDKQCAYRIAWRRLEEAGIVDQPVRELSLIDMQGAINDYFPNAYYPRKDGKDLLSNLCNLAHADHNAEKGVAREIELPQLVAEETEPFTADEVDALVAAYNNGDDVAGYALIMIYTAMMPAELFDFRPEMIDYDNQTIIGAGHKTQIRKDQPIVFPSYLIEVLKHLSEQSNPRTGQFLPWEKKKFYTEWHKMTDRVGVRPLKPYSCRHTAPTLLTEAGVPEQTIDRVLRHGSERHATTSTRVYIHHDIDMVRNVLDMITPDRVDPV